MVPDTLSLPLPPQGDHPVSAPKKIAKGALAVALLDAGLKLAAVAATSFAATKAVKAVFARRRKKK